MKSLIKSLTRGIRISNFSEKTILFFATGFGSGYVPKAPGTVGTLAAIPIYLLLSELSFLTYLVLVVSMTLVGIWFCHQAEAIFGDHDNKRIVWDEIVGYLIAMAVAPAGWLWVILGFLFFRLFDILKPWPVSWADQKMGGGLGVMMDDVIAGILSLLCLLAVERLIV